jgi:predicted methyltransferase
MFERVLRAVAVIWLALVVPAVSRAEEAAPKSAPPGSVAEMLELPADNVRDALDSELRSPDDRTRDGAEKTEALLRAAGVARGMRVVDLAAGDGYFAQALAFAVRRFGKVWAGNDPSSMDPATAAAWKKRLQGPGGADISELTVALGKPLPPYVMRVDLVFGRGTSHEAIARSIDRTAIHKSALAALSPGGRYVVVDARAANGNDEQRSAALCRASEQNVRKEVEDAGFRFVAASDALRNTRDPVTSSACGKASADRFLLVFEKPAG